VQGVLVRRVIPSVGERRALLLGLSMALVSFVLYGFASKGWMVYAIIPLGSLGGLAAPAAQGLMSKSVSPTEQGMLQGGVASLNSVTMLLGPFVGVLLFGFFTSPRAPVQLPGVTFFLGALFLLAGLLLALRTFARTPELSQPHAEVTASH